MKEHTGMRPHDVLVLLKIIAIGNDDWYGKDLAYLLGISISEISESLQRSMIAGLLKGNKKDVNRLAFFEFLRFGLPYVFPQQPGGPVRGMPTAHSAAPMKNEVKSDSIYVWPDANAKITGLSIKPLHKNQPEACARDASLYELAALTDVLRVGKPREKEIAIGLLQEQILGEYE